MKLEDDHFAADNGRDISTGTVRTLSRTILVHEIRRSREQFSKQYTRGHLRHQGVDRLYSTLSFDAR